MRNFDSIQNYHYFCFATKLDEKLYDMIDKINMEEWIDQIEY